MAEKTEGLAEENSVWVTKEVAMGVEYAKWLNGHIANELADELKKYSTDLEALNRFIQMQQEVWNVIKGLSSKRSMEGSKPSICGDSKCSHE